MAMVIQRVTLCGGLQGGTGAGFWLEKGASYLPWYDASGGLVCVDAGSVPVGVHSRASGPIRSQLGLLIGHGSGRGAEQDKLAGHMAACGGLLFQAHMLHGQARSLTARRLDGSWGDSIIKPRGGDGGPVRSHRPKPLHPTVGRECSSALPEERRGASGPVF